MTISIFILISRDLFDDLTFCYEEQQARFVVFLILMGIDILKELLTDKKSSF